MSVDEALDLCSEICETIDEIDADTQSRAAACDFDLEEIRDRVCSVDETITRTRRVTEGQERALRNWQRGVNGWCR
jgi:hypothetical protein